jgi:hypothetical protein
MNARFRHWKASGGVRYLKEAWGHLQHVRDHAPPEYRDTMIENVPLHREIAAAWAEHGRGG